MISQFELTNFGPIRHAKGCSLGGINLLMGSNSCGKTFFLKALYSLIRSHEEFGRGDDNRELPEILSQKLYWTFQPDQLTDLIASGGTGALCASMLLASGSKIACRVTHDASSLTTSEPNDLVARAANSVYLPPKEVFSQLQLIQKTALVERTFGFDATYVDLALAVHQPAQVEPMTDQLSASRDALSAMYDGRIVFDRGQNRWVYKKDDRIFSLNITAEGIKKVAVLETLLANRYLSQESVVFIDEPESALHPTAIVQLLDIIAQLATLGVQFFIATHSYYVIKKLLLIAHQQQMPLPTFMANTNGDWRQSCLLQDGLPDNEIVNESIRLFEQEFTGIE